MIEALLNGLWQGALIVAVAAAITVLVPQRYAATRYAVWFAALVALAVVPLSGLLSLGLPQGTVFFSLSRTTTVATHVVSRAAGLKAAFGFGLLLGGGCVRVFAASCVQLRAHRSNRSLCGTRPGVRRTRVHVAGDRNSRCGGHRTLNRHPSRGFPRNARFRRPSGNRRARARAYRTRRPACELGATHARSVTFFQSVGIRDRAAADQGARGGV